MPPTAPVDSDIHGTTLYVVEDFKIWKGTPVGGGAAAWTEVYNIAAYEASKAGADNTQFRRVVVRGTVVYVMGWTQYAGQIGTNQYTAVCWYSLSAGKSWGYSGIAEFALAEPNWYFDIEQTIDYETSTGDTVTFDFVDKYTLHVWGEFTGTGFQILSYHPMIAAECDVQRGVPNNVKFTMTGTLPLGFDPTSDDTIIAVQWDLIAWREGVEVATNTYLADRLNNGSPSWNKFRITHSQNGAEYACHFDYYLTITEVDGVPVATHPPIAFDAGRSNPAYVYCGIGEKIYRTTVGIGYWGEFYSLHGANDLIVDPQASGAIYYVSTSGSLNLMISDGNGHGVISSELYTETPLAVPRRIAREWDTGRLWFIDSGTSLRCRELGSWTLRKSSLSGGTGLNVYRAGKMIMVDAADVWVSDDYGLTWAAKKGGWTQWTGAITGVNAHRLATMT